MPLHRSPSSSNYSSQPNLSTGDEDDLKVKFNTRKRKNPENEQFIEFCKDMKNCFRDFQTSQETKYDNLFKAIEALTLQNTKLIESNSEIEKILQQNKDQQNVLMKKISTLELQCTDAHYKIDMLEDQLEQLHKQQLKTVIEIRNVPKVEKENLHNMVINMMETIETDINKDSINEVYRGGKGKAPIIIEFKNLNQKIQVLKAVKSYNRNNKDNKLNCSDLGVTISKTPVYVSEKLTPKTKKLLYSAKQYAKDGLFKYCWISNGTVFLKEDENKPPISIKNVRDLEILNSGNRLD